VLRLVLFFLFVPASLAQVVSPVEIKDPTLRELQTTYMEDLRAAAQDILAIKTDYPFYLSRKLDLDETQQKAARQSSIRFDQYNGLTVLAVTGNYFASYQTASVSPERRTRTTYENVVLPILQAVVPHFQNNREVQGYAVELAHHVRAKVMDVEMERAENLFVYFPKNAALKLLAAKDDTTRQAALLEAQFLLNGEAETIWLEGQTPQMAAKTSSAKAERGISGPEAASDARQADADMPAKKTKDLPSPPPLRDTSPAAIASLQTVNQKELDALAKQLGDQAHLVAYAPPTFIPFRHEIYLQLSMNTELPESAAGSRYKLAALAFDNHIAELLRPVTGHFKDEQQFDGVDFSTTVHLAGRAAGTKSESVEFLFPFSGLHCYEKYECTGQQLIDAGTVLINGERVSLDLQIAEAGAAR
jgi:hypothetical protein